MKIVVIILVAAISISTVAGKKPNILWIVTDDQRPDSLQCFSPAVYAMHTTPLG